MRSLRWALGSLVWALLASHASALTEKPCSQIEIETPTRLALTRTEKKLICGDSETPAWREIPLNQAQYFIRRFLSSRGFHAPTFSREGNRLLVQAGDVTVIKLITLKDAPTYIDVSRFWEPIGKPLTPRRLDDIERWVSKELNYLGYPCATLKTRASPFTGEVTVTVKGGPFWIISNIDQEPIPGLLSDTPRRYDPFKIGDPYDGMLLELSAQRLVGQDIAMSSHFITDCRAAETGNVKQIIFSGQPRILSFGVGFDTEQYAIAQASWRNSRLGPTASSLSFASQVSYVKQGVAGDFDWYYLPFTSRHFLRSSVRFEREFERRFESRNFVLQSAPALQFDALGGSTRIVAGPAYRSLLTVRGEGPHYTRLLTFDVNVDYMTHDFEYYMASPRAGHSLSFNASIADRSVVSTLSALRWGFSSTKLWNIAFYDPPRWVLGIRGEYETTAPRDTDRNDLPATFRNFLGGSNNLRGFGRKSLPASDQGALTKAYLGTELRANYLLPYKLQPFIFTDFGWLGETSQELDPNLFWSPGFGTRWESPIGTMRATLGRGYISGRDAERLAYLARWQFYFSFGEQF